MKNYGEGGKKDNIIPNPTGYSILKSILGGGSK